MKSPKGKGFVTGANNTETMKCADFEKELMLQDFSGRLSPEMKAHAASCSGCQALVGRYEGLFAAVGAEKAMRVSPYTATRLMGRLRGEQEVTRGFALRPAMAVAFAIAFFVGLSGAWFGQGSLKQSTASMVMNDYFAESPTTFEIESSWINIINDEK